MNTEILIGKPYEEAKRILEKNGMQLCEYGGEKFHYAIYNHDGIRYHTPSVTLEYTLGKNGCVTDAYEN